MEEPKARKKQAPDSKVRSNIARRKNSGRKLFDGKDEQITVQKLEQAFSYGATDREACGYADISERAFYAYQKKHPEFLQRKGRLKDVPLLKARQAWIKSFEEKPELAARYLENKRSNEFSKKEQTEISGEIKTTESLISPEAKEKMRQIYEEDVRKKILNIKE